MGTRALFSVPGQLIWFANGGGGEVAFVLLSVIVMVGVIYVKDCVVCVFIYLYALFNGRYSGGAILLWHLMIDHGCIDVSPIPVGSPN